MKTCTKCGIEKSKSKFEKEKRNRDGIGSRCKECAKKYRATPGGRLAARKGNKKYQASQKGKVFISRSNRKRSLKRLYNITIEDYDLMLRDQEYGCAICGTDKPGGMGRFHVDHDHKTGRVRGLLCHRCNSILGYSGDSIEILIRAIKYLVSDDKMIVEYITGRKEAKRIERDGK